MKARAIDLKVITRELDPEELEAIERARAANPNARMDAEAPPPLDYKRQLIQLLKLPNRDVGMDFDEMERCVRLIGVLRQANGRVLLEQQDWEFVRDRVNQARWMRADAAFVQFVRDVREAPEVKVEEKAE